jgi:YjbR protein
VRDIAACGPGEAALTPADVRRIALALPGTVERDHHGFPSFRTARRIFATLPDEQHLRVMLSEEDIRAAVAEWPAWCAEQWWGRRLAALRISLPACEAAVVAELVEDAWRLHS